LAIYRRDRFLGHVRVAAKGPIDRVTKTDGLDANAALDLLVVHDNWVGRGEVSSGVLGPAARFYSARAAAASDPSLNETTGLRIWEDRVHAIEADIDRLRLNLRPG
jgi:hypothetical protein